MIGFLADGSTCGRPFDRQQPRRKTTFATLEKIQAIQRRKTTKVDVLAKVNLG
jgi:hypothetical protein